MYATAGLGFKPEHFAVALSCSAAGMWYEIHAENYMVAGGPRMRMLDALRAQHPIAVHGVGLSLAGDAAPDAHHLSRLKAVIERTQALVVSEHLAWCTAHDAYYPDLLPFPRTNEALQRITRNIEITQNTLKRQILIENPSAYLHLDTHEWSEAEFLSELVRRSGCGLLLDVNNVYVSARNLGGDAHEYLNALPAAAIGEIHLAGHTVDQRADTALLIDTHGAPICAEVWSLYQQLITRIGARPTLIERDDNIPAFDELLAERDHAADLLAEATGPVTSQELRHAHVS
jgi:uncharacterized protein (UPF0276 family)